MVTVTLNAETVTVNERGKMKLEDQVCSLEYAKRLAEIGAKQESLFWRHPEKGTIIYCPHLIPVDTNCNHSAYYSSFTSVELGEMLPDNVYTQKDCAELKVEWICHHITGYKDDVWIADNEVDARALMLIYLLENNLVKAEDLK